MRRRDRRAIPEFGKAPPARAGRGGEGPPEPPARAAAGGAGGLAAAAAGVVGWVRADVPIRAPLAAAPAVWLGGTGLHLAGVPGLYPAAAAGLAGAAAAEAIRYRAGGQLPAWVAGSAAGAGAWAAALAELGPGWGNGLLTLGGFGAAVAAYRQYLRTDLIGQIAAARRREAEQARQRAEWAQIAERVGLGGSALAEQADTRLGWEWRLDVRGTGKRASALAGRALAEDVAAVLDLPASRVSAWPGRLAGRLVIAVRARDPWAAPIPHPLLDPDPEIQLPATDTCRTPLLFGLDPDTGARLELPVVRGGSSMQHTLVIAASDAGKSVLVNNLLERGTACLDLRPWMIDVVKGHDTDAWAPALDWSAAGPENLDRAMDILEAAARVATVRPQARRRARGQRTFEPSPQRPAVLLIIDEAAGLLGQDAALRLAAATGRSARQTERLVAQARALVVHIAQAGRSEGAALLLISQRASERHIPNEIRANIHNVVLGRTQSQNEDRHALAAIVEDLPDMRAYAEGHAGVWAIARKGVPGSVRTGRAFLLGDDEFDHMRAWAAERRPPRGLEPEVAHALGEPYARRHEPPALVAAGPAPAAADAGAPAPAPPTLGAVYGHLQDAAATLGKIKARSGDVPVRVRRVILDTLADAGEAGVSRRDIEDATGLAAPTAGQYLTALYAMGLIDKRGDNRATRWHLPTDSDENEGQP
jgi:DNA-binding transcriptional ArsR family regulator